MNYYEGKHNQILTDLKKIDFRLTEVDQREYANVLHNAIFTRMGTCFFLLDNVKRLEEMIRED